MRKRYQFWLTLLKTWATTQTEPITQWTVQYAGHPPRRHDPDFRRWTEPGVHARTLEADTVIPWDDAILEVGVRGETLLRIDGKPAYGFNPFHTRFAPHLAQGTPIHLALEQVTTGLMGVHVPDPGLGEVRWILLDRAAKACYWDLAVLMEWGDDPDTPPDLTRWLTRALDQALMPLISSAPDADAVRAYAFRDDRSAEEEGLTQALAAGVPVGLAAIDQKSRGILLAHLESHLRHIFRDLRRLAPDGPGTLLMMGHAHIDLAWLWPMAETSRKVVRTAASQAHLLDMFPDWHFGISSPEMWQVIESEPDLRERWFRLADDRRVDPLGAFWVESDTQLLGATSLLRHLMLGLRYFESRLGRRPLTAFLPDTFGFSGALPTFLKAAGIRLFLTTKINWNDSTTFPYKHFRWVGPDGSSVQAMIFGSSPDGYNGQASIRDLKTAWTNFANGGGDRAVLYAFGHGDGGGGPDESMLERLRRYRELPLMPALHNQSVESLIRPPEELKQLPRWHGDLYLEFHRGVFTTRTHVKAESRQVERQLSATECWALLSGSAADLHEVWTLYLRNHFHDILPGSSIATVYADFERDMVRVRDALRGEQQAVMARAFPDEKATGTTLIIGNSASLARPAGIVTLNRRRQVAIFWGRSWHQSRPVDCDCQAVDLPRLDPLSLAAFPLKEVDEPADASAIDVPRTETAFHWSSGPLDVVVGPEGIQSLKHGGRELLDGPAGVAAFFQHPPEFDAWELQPPTQRGNAPLDHDTPIIEWDQQQRAIIRLTHRRGASTISERIILDGHLAQIESEIRMTIRERHLVIQYRVPTTLRTRHVSRETLFGVDTLPTGPAGPSDDARFEWAAHRFIDLAEPHQGLALLNNGRYGHSVDDGTMGITLSTAPLYPDPMADADPEPVRIALLPHDHHWTDDAIMERAAAFSDPPMVAERQTGLAQERILTPLTDLPPNVALLAVKPAEDGSGDWIYHLGEVWGDTCTATVTWPHPVAAASLVDLVSERPLSPLIVENQVTTSVVINPHQLVLLRTCRAIP